MIHYIKKVYNIYDIFKNKNEIRLKRNKIKISSYRNIMPTIILGDILYIGITSIQIPITLLNFGSVNPDSILIAIQYRKNDELEWNTSDYILCNTLNTFNFNIENLEQGIAYNYRYIFKVNNKPIIMIDNNIKNITTYKAKATGGIIEVDGNYITHIFKGSANFIPLETLNAEYLIIGGGSGNPGYSDEYLGGGGGAGGFVEGAFTAINNTSYPVIVGAGGSNNGTASSVFNITALPGGRGGIRYWAGGSTFLYQVPYGINSGTHASGGGANHTATTINDIPYYYNPMPVSGKGTSGQGNNGGIAPNGTYYASGGGGAGSGGGRHGGEGKISNRISVKIAQKHSIGHIVDNNVWFSGGGDSYEWPLAPSKGGGGGYTGQIHTGGGAMASWIKGAGGSGVVIIRYLI